MKSCIRLVLVSVLLPLLLTGTALAVEDHGTESGLSTPSSEQASESSQAVTELTDQQKKELSTRVQNRKSQLKVKLSTVQQKRLKDRCKSAQGLIRNANGKAKSVETSRGKMHTKLIDRLKELSINLKTQSIDTADLDATITDLEAKIATFNTDQATYQQAVSDLANIDDCTSDPAAFQASLESARVALKQVHEDAVAIRSYVKDTIKPTLNTIREQLHVQATDNTDNTEKTNGTN